MFPNAVVCGHRDFAGVSKECPSFDAKTWWASALTLSPNEEPSDKAK
jgi:hypothetical protein